MQSMVDNTPEPRRRRPSGKSAERSAPRPVSRGIKWPREHYEAMLLEHLPFIERTVAAVARRHALKPWDADDLEGQVKLRLVADDYAVLRKFEGRSKLTTFLTTVIMNQFRDYRIKRWGKWRPSAAAKRLGELGIQLELLLYRDGYSRREALAILRDRFQVDTSDDELLSIAGMLKARTNRRFENDSLLARLAGPDRSDQRVLDRERRESSARAERALRTVLAALDPEDRLILKLRFADSLTIRAIATSLHLPQRQMYTRVQRLLVAMRRGIERQGVACDEVMDLLDRAA